MAGFWGALVLLFAGVAGATAGTLFTNPIIVVTPMTLDFGPVPAKGTATNTFLAENAGGGKLVGKATVRPPFKIIQGGRYELRENEAQVVTIVYRPTTARTNIQTVFFSGDGGAKATVVGRLSVAGPKR